MFTDSASSSQRALLATKRNTMATTATPIPPRSAPSPGARPPVGAVVALHQGRPVAESMRPHRLAQSRREGSASASRLSVDRRREPQHEPRQPVHERLPWRQPARCGQLSQVYSSFGICLRSGLRRAFEPLNGRSRRQSGPCVRTISRPGPRDRSGCSTRTCANSSNPTCRLVLSAWRTVRRVTFHHRHRSDLELLEG